MNSGVARLPGLLAVALLIPACRMTFTTGDSMSPLPPNDPFVLEVPFQGKTGVWPTNTQFAWGAYPGAAAYELELSRTSDFAQVLHRVSNLTFTSVFLTVNLTHGTTYYWRVSTLVNAVPVYAAGSPFQFTTVVPVYGPPDPFFLLSPVGGTAGPVPDPVFTWQYAPQAVGYTFQLDTTDQFLSPIVDLTDLRLSQLTCPVVLAATTTYYWRVTAVNSGGSRPSTPSFSSFTTGP